jgi:hypothetical protein
MNKASKSAQAALVPLTLLLVVLAWSASSCSGGATTTTSSAVPTTTTLAPSTTSTSISQLPIWSYTSMSTPPTLAGLTPFPMLLDHYGRLLDMLEVPGTLPYAVLGADELAPIFKNMVPDSVTGAQGFQLANGDTVILFATNAGPAWDQVIKAFTDTYGGEGREVTEHLSDDWGYLAASKVYAEDFAMLVDIAYQVQELESALATAHDLFRTAGSEDSLAEEYAVYSALIQSLYNNALIVIEDTTAQPDSGLFSPRDAINTMRGQWPELGDDILSDFKAKNQTSSALESRFILSARYVFISTREIESIFSNNAGGWDDFYAKYPGSQGILTLSRVGFNDAKDTAVLYAGNQSHWVNGEGNVVLMKKTADRWTVHGEAMMWIS